MHAPEALPTPASTLVGGWLAAVARRQPDKIALRCDGRAVSYAGLAAASDAVAAALLRAGLREGGCVAWLGVNSIAMLSTLFGCARLGAIFMPLNWRLAPPEHAAMLRDCPPKLLVADAAWVKACRDGGVAPPGTRCLSHGAEAADWASFESFVDAGAGVELPAAALEPKTPLLLCFTSGSTGRPKGVLLSQDALAANADASVDMHALTADDRILTTLPLFHVGGLNILTTPALRAGCSVTLHAKFDPDATFDAIERERITLTVLVPAQLEMMLAHPRWARADLSSLRMITTGSTIVPERLIRTVQERGIPLVSVWGATETSPIAACLHADEAVRKVGSTGRAALGCELRLINAFGEDVPPGTSGELLVRGRNVMLGYWRDDEANRKALAAGWFHSGDSAHADDEGFITIDGRLKDMIITGGENVSPAEVEAVLLDSPDVAQASVVGRADPRWGEKVVAVVVPQPGASLTQDSVLALFEGRLARFKHPKEVLIVEALPSTALGKVRKDDVRKLVANHFAHMDAGPSGAARANPSQERTA